MSIAVEKVDFFYLTLLHYIII